MKGRKRSTHGNARKPEHLPTASSGKKILAFHHHCTLSRSFPTNMATTGGKLSEKDLLGDGAATAEVEDQLAAKTTGAPLARGAHHFAASILTTSRSGIPTVPNQFAIRFAIGAAARALVFSHVCMHRI